MAKESLTVAARIAGTVNRSLSVANDGAGVATKASRERAREGRQQAAQRLMAFDPDACTSVSCTVGQVVAQVRAVDRDALAIGENAHVVPIDLRVTEAWPAVHLRLPHELVPRAVFGAGEQQLASVAVDCIAIRLAES